MKFEKLTRRIPPWPKPTLENPVCLIAVQHKDGREESYCVSKEDSDRICNCKTLNTEMLESQLLQGVEFEEALQLAGYVEKQRT